MTSDQNIVLKDEDFSRQVSLDASFKLVKKANDPRFGEIKLYQNPESRAVIAVREITIGEKNRAEKEIVKCKKRLRMENQYILPLVDYSVEKQSSLCSSFFLFRLYYEYPPTDVKRELSSRKAEGVMFSSDELLHLLYQQMEAHRHLELTKSFHGDVRPLHWGLNNQLWHTKLIYKPEEIDSRQAVLQVQLKNLQLGNDVYQSPSMYENLMRKNLKHTFSPNKEDMFATAMVLLELGIQQSLQDVYGKDGKFDHDAMRAHVAKFESLYSGVENQLLVTAILTMLEPEEDRRPHFILLHEHVPPYKDVIQHYGNIKAGIYSTVNKPLEAFIYIDKSIIEGFTLEPGVKHVKVQGGAFELPQNAAVNSKYSERNINTGQEGLSRSKQVEGRIIERIIRRFEERDDKMIEKVEHFDVLDNNEMVKTKEYELIDGKHYNLKYFDKEGKETSKEEHKEDDQTKRENADEMKDKDSQPVEHGGLRAPDSNKQINGDAEQDAQIRKSQSFNKMRNEELTEEVDVAIQDISVENQMREVKAQNNNSKMTNDEEQGKEDGGESQIKERGSEKDNNPIHDENHVEEEKEPEKDNQPLHEDNQTSNRESVKDNQPTNGDVQVEKEKKSEKEQQPLHEEQQAEAKESERDSQAFHEDDRDDTRQSEKEHQSLQEEQQLRVIESEKEQQPLCEEQQFEARESERDSRPLDENTKNYNRESEKEHQPPHEEVQFEAKKSERESQPLHDEQQVEEEKASEKEHQLPHEEVQFEAKKSERESQPLDENTKNDNRESEKEHQPPHEEVQFEARVSERDSQPFHDEQQVEEEKASEKEHQPLHEEQQFEARESERDSQPLDEDTKNYNRESEKEHQPPHEEVQFEARVSERDSQPLNDEQQVEEEKASEKENQPFHEEQQFEASESERDGQAFQDGKDDQPKQNTAVEPTDI